MFKMCSRRLAFGLVLALLAASDVRGEEQAVAASLVSAESQKDALWATIYDRPQRLAALRQPAVCLLDIQHRDIIRTQLEKLANQNTPTRVIGLKLGRTEDSVYAKASEEEPLKRKAA